MSKMSRTKGQVGEREVALELSRLTGKCIRRRVRNAAGDSDLEGLNGWSIGKPVTSGVPYGLRFKRK